MSVCNVPEFLVEAFRVTPEDWSVFGEVTANQRLTESEEEAPLRKQWRNSGKKYLCSKEITVEDMQFDVQKIVDFELTEAFPPYPSLGMPSLCANVVLAFSSPVLTTAVTPPGCLSVNWGAHSI